MPKHLRKIIAPVIIVLIITVYYIAGALVVFNKIIPWASIPGALKAVAVALPLAIIGGILYVLIERIREIRSGEEDDLGKY